MRRTLDLVTVQDSVAEFGVLMSAAVDDSEDPTVVKVGDADGPALYTGDLDPQQFTDGNVGELCYLAPRHVVGAL
jgi:hypothetical protein